ncbi:MAG: hypothetical protein C5B54_06085 [Acidobacteria bacterium]|nr:MAG: hypothetical protein C5B54_06085 [Acidobacteriota bacterium]
MDLSAVRDFARRYTAAWCSQHPERVASYYAEDGSLTINNASPSVSRAGITIAAQSFMTAFPDMIVEMDDLEQQKNGYVFRWTLIGTNTGPGGTGKKVHISGYEEWTMSPDGLIEKSLGHFDEAEYQRQLKFGVESRTDHAQ